MSKYLELVPKLNTITLAKSFTFPYIAVEDTEEQACQYTPKTDGVPILADNNTFVKNIDSPKEVRVYVPTYLFSQRITVKFIPDSESSTTSPVVTTSSLTGDNTMTQHMDSILIDGKNAWDVPASTLGRTWQTQVDLLLMSIQLFETGVLQIQTGDVLSNALNGPHLSINSELSIDSPYRFLLPKVDLALNKSCYVYWESESAATLLIGQQISDEINPSTNYNVQESISLNPNEYLQIYDNISNWDMVFKSAKLISSTPGILKMIDFLPPLGGAIIIRHNTPEFITSDNQTLFCILNQQSPIVFTSSAESPVTIFISGSHEFSISSDDANVVASYTSYLANGVQTLQLSLQDMKDLTANITGDYIYLKVLCDADTSLTVSDWTASGMSKTKILQIGQQFAVASVKSAPYRIPFTSIKGKNLALTWTGNSTLPTYIAKISDFVLSSTSSNVLHYKNVPRKSTYEIPAETVSLWEANLEDGFVYVVFNKPSKKGNVTFTVTDPTV